MISVCETLGEQQPSAVYSHSEAFEKRRSLVKQGGSRG